MHRHTQPRPAPLLRTLVLAVVCLTRELLAHHVGGERQRLAAGVRVDLQLREAITAAATRLYGDDREYSPSFEPSGEDFLSPGLCEMTLMRRVLPTAKDFTAWARGFMPSLLCLEDDSDDSRRPYSYILSIPAILDRTDARLVHLDGLLLSKAWALRACANDLDAGGGGVGAYRALAPVTAAMREAADAHYEAAEWDSDAYVGSHWLHSFALLALDGE